MPGGWVWSNGSKRREWIAVDGYGGAARVRWLEKVRARIGLTRWVEADEARIAALSRATQDRVLPLSAR